MAKAKSDDTHKGSVWFVARVRVRMPAGMKPGEAARLVGRAMHEGVEKRFGEDNKGGGVVLIEDPAKVLGHEEHPPVPVVIGAVTMCPGEPKVGECLKVRQPERSGAREERVVAALLVAERYRFADKALVKDVAREAIKAHAAG